MDDLKEITTRVADLAREAGAFITKSATGFSYSDVELKGKSDLVSFVDKEAEKLLVKKLRKILPEAGFITEENTVDQSEQEQTWIIDPLDGTTNFVHGVPTFAVSIGLKSGNEIVSGVVYEVNRDECFYAWKEGGAYLNGKAIRVTAIDSIEESLFSTGFPPYNFNKLNEYLAILNALMENSHGIRRVGSAATDLAYVACGRYEGFFEYNLKPWDVAAGIILVREAGGILSDFKGGDDFLFGREIIAASPVHPELLAVIKKHWFK